MAGVNKVILIGNLGKDPELRKTPSGSSVVNFSLATTERYTGREGQKQEKTEWHNIVAWNRLAELANQYLRKGRSAYIEGRITTRSWDDRDGNKRYRTEIVANTIQFLSGGSDQGGGGGGDSTERVEEPGFDIPNGLEEPPSQVPEDDLPF